MRDLAIEERFHVRGRLKKASLLGFSSPFRFDGIIRRISQGCCLQGLFSETLRRPSQRRPGRYVR